MEPFELQQSEGKPTWFRVSAWENNYPVLSAGFTSRHGGVSTGDYQSLNCALHIQDDPTHVIQNRRRLAEHLDIPFDAWTCGEQVHGTGVAVITEADRGRGRESREDAFADTDAMITDIPGIWLTSFYADCVPLYFFDPHHSAVGLAHAGWKGTVQEIARKTVEAMELAYGSQPEHLLAAIGPSIQRCCYEVDDRVIREIEACLDKIGAAAADRAHVHKEAAKEGKRMLSLQEMNRQIMIKAGIMPHHIELCGMCTSCRTDLFFSHRKERGATGRMASWIGIGLTARHNERPSFS